MIKQSHIAFPSLVFLEEKWLAGREETEPTVRPEMTSEVMFCEISLGIYIYPDNYMASVQCYNVKLTMKHQVEGQGLITEPKVLVYSLILFHFAC